MPVTRRRERCHSHRMARFRCVLFLDAHDRSVIISQVYAYLWRSTKLWSERMKPKTRSTGRDSHERTWLTLGQAAEFLGVHPATLRRWADDGEVPCIRTPGGHRRFLEEGLHLFLSGQAEPAHDAPSAGLERSLVLDTRRQLRSPEAREMSWHKAFREEDLADRRASGRRLLGLAIQFTSRSTGREAILTQARSIGNAYGRDAFARGLSVVDLTKAFLFFRESLIRSARPGLSERGRYDAEDVHIHRSLRQFLDEVLFATMAGYEEGLLPYSRSPESLQ